MRIRVWSLGLRAYYGDSVLGFGAWGVGLGLYGLGIRVWGLGFGV